MQIEKLATYGWHCDTTFSDTVAQIGRSGGRVYSASSFMCRNPQVLISSITSLRGWRRIWRTNSNNKHDHNKVMLTVYCLKCMLRNRSPKTQDAKKIIKWELSYKRSGGEDDVGKNDAFSTVFVKIHPLRGSGKSFLCGTKRTSLNLSTILLRDYGYLASLKLMHINVCLFFSLW